MSSSGGGARDSNSEPLISSLSEVGPAVRSLFIIVGPGGDGVSRVGSPIRVGDLSIMITDSVSAIE